MIDMDKKIITGTYPMIAAAGITYELLDNTLFLSARSVNEIYTDDRAGIFSRLVPGIEWWPLNWLSLRGGAELSYLSILDVSRVGYGGLLGVSAKMGRFTADINLGYRYMPYKVYAQEGEYQDRFLIGLSYAF